MTARRIRIRTPSRLHFGLLGWGPQAVRQFGGVGLMIEDPGLELVGETAPEWTFEGPLAPRVEQVVRRLVEESRSDRSDFVMPAGARIEVLSAPAEHVGLGVGTQLSLAVVRLLLELAGTPPRRPKPSRDLPAAAAAPGSASTASSTEA